MSRPDPFDAFDPRVDEVLRRGLGRLADESPRYVDAQELSTAVLTRARHDRTSRRLAACAAAMVPVAALAGWALGVADRGGPGPGETVAGGHLVTASPVIASPSPTTSAPVTGTQPAATAGTQAPDAPALPTPGLPNSGTSPKASASPSGVPTPSSPTSSPTAPAASPTATPSSTATQGPQALSVTLSVDVTGTSVSWRVTWSGGPDPVASVAILDGADRVLTRTISDDCTLAPSAGVSEGVLELKKPGEHRLRAWVSARGCDGDVTRRSDTATVSIDGEAPEPTPTPTATPTPTPTGTAPASPSPTPARGGDRVS
ncbi:serine/threonine-protein kinase [Motilibacter deserti]|uniref:Ig-like domain-containing protein n=1 Tax=Motilibacter deserti TaxID=2714956 RepID=A0ABX0H050_9ACTN|nr:hypothetical protein [Motilibacter deserti]NHC15209.1 hypothetical protein [Motilibacter deserti]